MNPVTSWPAFDENEEQALLEVLQSGKWWRYSYGEAVEYLHLNAVKAGLVGRAQDWRWCSVNEYCGMSAAQPMRRCGLTIAILPLDSKARI